MAGLMDTDGPQQQQINGSHHHPTGSSGSMAAKTVTNHHNNNNNHQSQHGLPTNPPPFLCSGCARPIVDQYLLKALDCFWHEDCLKCGCCDCRLGEVGSTLYTKANLILCKRDYLRMFGTSGSCAACCKPIPAFEMVMRAKSNVYHLDCFACQQCHQRFCVGDRFYLNDNKILCEYDYEDRLVAANNLPSTTNNSSSVNNQHIQRRVSDMHQQPAAAGSRTLTFTSTHNGQSGISSGYGHHLSDGWHFRQGVAASAFQQIQPSQQYAANRQLHHLASHSQQHKHGSPSDGSSSGYGSPDSVLLDER